MKNRSYATSKEYNLSPASVADTVRSMVLNTDMYGDSVQITLSPNEVLELLRYNDIHVYRLPEMDNVYRVEQYLIPVTIEIKK